MGASMSVWVLALEASVAFCCPPPMEMAKPSLLLSTFSPARMDLLPKAVSFQPEAAVMETDFTRTAP